MHKKQYLGAAALAAVLIAAWFLIRWIGSAGYINGFKITALPVGKADALILQEGDTAVLIDTG